jgi:CubicO group peptidase (beta-lactamase class C family)
MAIAPAIENALEQALAETGINGAVAMVGNRAGLQGAVAIGHAPDAIFQLASMTKAIVSVAAMQLVEAGKLSLDAPIGERLPDLAAPRVITGFAADGKVETRPAARPMTLRHLLTHTAGMGYDFMHADQGRARTAPVVPGTIDSIRVPLLFDPGAGWAYGISTDWVGLAVEAASGMKLDAYIAAHITAPLGMTETVFALAAERKPRLVTNMARGNDGTFVPYPINIGGGAGEFISGGGGMSGTAADYLRFVRMILNGGSLAGVTILKPETVAEMGRNHIGSLRAGVLGTTMPELTSAIDWFPGQDTKWGLGFMINPEAGPNGRGAGSLAWAGICNTYFWIDPANDIAAVLLMQLLPFADPAALAVLGAFERAVYAG